MVEEIDEHKFYEEVLNSEDTWLIDFYASWCGHCHSFAPHFSKLAKVRIHLIFGIFQREIKPSLKGYVPRYRLRSTFQTTGVE